MDQHESTHLQAHGAASPTTGAKPARNYLALGLGIIGALVWFMLLTSLGKGSGKPIVVVVGLVSAFGVWRCTADLNWGGAKRGILGAVALVPGAGFIVSVAVLLQVVRARI